MKVSEVFGVRKAYELHNYVVRDGIDDTFLAAVEVGKHVSVYGSSKTGKSSLIQKYVGDSERLCVQCAANWSYNDFIDAVLHAAFGRVETETLTENETGNEIDIGVRVSTNLKLLQGAIGNSFKRKNNRIVRTKDNHLYDLENPGDFVRLFSDLGYGQGPEREKLIYLIIDDFHRLTETVQEAIAGLAKMLFDNANVVVIVVGIWIEENKLSSLCAELMGRCVDINCNVWPNESLIDVVDNGCQMLRIEFPPGLAEYIVKHSYSSVFIVQEACREACKIANITSAQEEHYSIDKTINAAEIVNSVTARECNFTDLHNKLMRLEGNDSIALFAYAIMIDKSGKQSLDMDSLQAIVETKFDAYKFDRHFSENSSRRFNDIIRERNLGKIFDFYRDAKSGKYVLSLVDNTIRFWLKGRRKEFIRDIRERVEKQMEDRPFAGVSIKPTNS
jgi:hypothetical protein